MRGKATRQPTGLPFSLVTATVDFHFLLPSPQTTNPTLLIAIGRFRFACLPRTLSGERSRLIPSVGRG